MNQLPDPLDAATAQVEQELAVGMMVRGFLIEGLKVAIHPEFPHHPVTASQKKPLEKDGAEGAVGLLPGASLAARGGMSWCAVHWEDREDCKKKRIGRRIKSFLC